MIIDQVPEFCVLDAEDVHAILSRNYVGRLAFDWGGRVDIRPLHYVFSGGRIYGRTSPGVKFAQFAGPQAPVAFEVDEVEAVFRWKSVIVRGRFDILSPDGAEAAERWRAAQLLRRIVKNSLEASDPVPERDIIFRITVDEATGRASH
jgi:uncharacterized protein